MTIEQTGGLSLENLEQDRLAEILFKAMRPDAGNRLHGGTDDRWGTWDEIKDHPALRERYDAGARAIVNAAHSVPDWEAVARIVEGCVADSIGGDWEDAVQTATDAILSLFGARHGE